MLVLDVKNELLTPGIVGIWNPPATLAGMVNVGLDARGQLNFLQVLPPEVEDAPPQPRAPDWDALFVAAGFDRSQFQEAEPRWTSLAASDARKAWTGTWPGTRLPLRVEAAAFHGKPVYFTLVSPWTPPYRTQADRRTSGEKAAAIAVIALSLLVVVAAILLARRNYLSGRGDRRGAVRLAVAVFCLQMTLWLGRAHHFPSIGEFGLLVAAIAYSLFASAHRLAALPVARALRPPALAADAHLLEPPARGAAARSAGRAGPAVGRPARPGLVPDPGGVPARGSARGRLAAARLDRVPAGGTLARGRRAGAAPGLHPLDAHLLLRAVPAAGAAAADLAGGARLRRSSSPSRWFS